MSDVAKYRKKPVEIEAVRLSEVNYDEVCLWCDGVPTYRGKILLIHTLEGTMRANIGDWIIKGVNGEFYPCKPDIFEATYEPVTIEEGR